MSYEGSCQCGQAPGACKTEFQYAVKIVCGEVQPASGHVPTPVAPGRYWTAVNIHNPTKCEDAHLRWKVSVAYPGRPGPVSLFADPGPLEPDKSLEIDCAQILGGLLKPFHLKFVKGYVVIASDIELDVVAVYTSAPGAKGPVNTFHTERVQPRCVAVCEDLVLPLHTGLADWRTIFTPPVGPVAAVSPLATGWGPPPFGSVWVSQNSTDGTAAHTGPTLRYELCFDLCFGYTIRSPLSIQMLADGSAKLFLNGAAIPGAVVPTGGWGGPPTTINVSTVFLSQHLKAGRNCFRADITNGTPKLNPTGFALAGILHAAGGKCPCSPLPLAPPPPPFAPFSEGVETSDKRRSDRSSGGRRKAKGDVRGGS